MNCRSMAQWAMGCVLCVVVACNAAACSDEQTDCSACDAGAADCPPCDAGAADCPACDGGAACDSAAAAEAPHGDADARAPDDGDASLPGLDGWAWPQAEWLLVTLEIDAEKAAAWLPEGLTMVEPGTAFVFIANYPNSMCCGPYHEAAILLLVMHEGTPKLHCPWMLVDDDIALVMGREFMGYPKKMGEISLQIMDGEVKAMVKRGTATLIEATGTLGDAVDTEPAALPNVNVWGAENALYNTALPAPRLIAFDIARETLSQTEVDVDFDLQGSSGDPIDEMGVMSVSSATLTTLNMGSLNREDYAFTLWDEVDAAYQQRVFALRYGRAP